MADIREPATQFTVTDTLRPAGFTYEHHVGLLEVGDADLLGGHDLQERQEHHGEEGCHWEGDTLRHPVHRLERFQSERK